MLMPLGVRVRLLTACCGCLSLFAGCGAGAPLDVGEDISPLTTSTTPAGTIVFGPNVYALSAGVSDAATVTADQLTFPAGKASGVTNRHSGDVLISSSSATTNAFMRKVVSVAR